MIGLSGLITAAYDNMRLTVEALRQMMAEDGAQIPILLGGQIDEQVCAVRGRGLLVDRRDGRRAALPAPRKRRVTIAGAGPPRTMRLG